MRADTNDDRIAHEVDVCVIGLGSGGEQLAEILANAGLSVIGFEPGLVGGECPFLACVPSKSLLHDAATGERSWSEAVERRDDLVDHRDDHVHADGLTDAGVTLIRERATIDGERCVVSDGHQVSADHVVIATGAAPVRPDVPGAELPDVWTSAEALSSAERPERLVVVGGGPIGSELSQVYARFGSTVTLCDHSDVLTEDAEPDIAESLADALSDDGVDVRVSVELERIERADGGLVAVVDGDEIPADRVLLAVGVEPRLDGLGLDTVGVASDPDRIASNGQVGGLDWLWAVGDVTPQSAWTHGASFQARSLAARIQGRAWPDEEPVMPRCTFTSPPLGVVGRTAARAEADGFDVIIGRADYADEVRAATDEIDQGRAAIVVDRRSGTLLGASIIGPRADDLIQIVTALMAAGSDLSTASRMVFPFPTLSQVIERAIADAADQLDE